MPFSSSNSTADQAALRVRPAARSDSAILDHSDLHLLEQTFRLIPDVVSIYDVDAQQVIYSNRSPSSVLGYEDESITEDGLLHPDDVAKADAQFQRTLELNDEESGEVAYRLKDASGSWRWFSERQVIFKRHVDGSPAQILKTARCDMGVARNITQQMEKVSVDLTLEREQSRMLSQFIGTTSHELRTPLTIINTSLYLMKKTKDPAKQGERLQIIEHQVAQLARLVGQMHMLLRVESMNDSSPTTPVALNKILARLEEDYESAIAKKELTFELVFEDTLPSIDVDPDLLLVALQNVLENAISYTDTGSIKAHTAVRDNEVILTIEDSGIGIDAEDLPHIFERFYKFEANKRRDTIAAGLGLAITRRIMELSGGRIEVESQLEHGTCFRLIWPVN